MLFYWLMLAINLEYWNNPFDYRFNGKKKCLYVCRYPAPPSRNDGTNNGLCIVYDKHHYKAFNVI